jgi:hypothetical protein
MDRVFYSNASLWAEIVGKLKFKRELKKTPDPPIIEGSACDGITPPKGRGRLPQH